MIAYRHYRVIDSQNNIASRGGATLAFTDSSNDDGGQDFAGAVAYCGPKDNFNFQYGRAKSAGRLVQFMSTSDYRTRDDGLTITGAQKTFRFDDVDRKTFLSEMDDYMEDLGYVRR